MRKRSTIWVVMKVLELIFTNDTENTELGKFESTMETLFTYTLEKLQVSAKEYEVSVTLVDETTIQQINRDYREKDAITDVISFAFLDDNTIVYPDGMPIPLGEIYICDARVYEQAKDYGHSVQREFHFLALHGLLHLLGYDHMTEEDETKMFALQADILNELGYERG